RRKVRIRWYGSLFGECKNPFLEIKNKVGQLGSKKRFELPEFQIDRGTNIRSINFFDNLTSVEEKYNYLQFLPFLKPELLNSYERTYYLSQNKKFRITLDKNMEYYSLFSSKKPLKTFNDAQNNILELKYDVTSSKEANQITKHFPFRVTKSSKYVSGIYRIKI
ncbi:VTC domain-containing protein, partial [Alphaproteobacteria bacterium]|nr:VTC domain-containing protein [Alphaproteobacteria bacterium]